MATETARNTEPVARPVALVGRAVVAGLVGGIAFGLLIQFAMGRMPTIGALYTVGEPNLVVGWIAHVGHSALFGMFYAFLAASDRLRPRVTRLPDGALVGIAYGAVLWYVNIGFLWPVWLNWVGVGGGLPVPFFAPMPLVGHVVYGLALGTGFALLIGSEA